MVSGFSDTECRIAEFRYRELLAEGDRQRRAASAASVPASRARVMALIGRRIGVVMAQGRQILLAALAQKATDHTTAPGRLTVH